MRQQTHLENKLVLLISPRLAFKWGGRERRKRGNWFSLQAWERCSCREPTRRNRSRWLSALALIKFFTSDLPTIFDFQSILRARRVAQPTAPASVNHRQPTHLKNLLTSLPNSRKENPSASWRIPVIFRKGIQQLGNPSRRKSQTGLANFRPISHRVCCLEPV